MLDWWLWDVVDRGSMERVGDRPRKRAFSRAFCDFNPMNDLVNRVETLRSAVSEWAIKIGTVARRKCRAWRGKARRLFDYSNLLQFCRNLYRLAL